MANTRNSKNNAATIVTSTGNGAAPTPSPRPEDQLEDIKGQPFMADFYPDKANRFDFYKRFISTAASVQWLVYALRALHKAAVLDTFVRSDAGLAFAAFSFYLLFHISVGGGKVWSNVNPLLFKAYIVSSALLGAAMFSAFWSDHVLFPLHKVPLETVPIAVEAALDLLAIVSVIITVMLGTDFVLHLRAEDGEGEEKEEGVVAEKKSRKSKKDE